MSITGDFRRASSWPTCTRPGQDQRPRPLRHRPLIDHAALSHRRTLRRVGTDDETLADLTVLTGYDDDLNQQSTRLTNRPRDALLHVHPALERLLGRHNDRRGVIDLLATADTPDAIAALGHDVIAELLRPRSPRLAKTLPAQILTALAEQTVVVPGTAAFGRIITAAAAQLRDVRLECDHLAASLRPAWRPTLLPRS